MNIDGDPCSKCRRNEICENGICIASGVDLCEGIQCGEQAFCQDGACVCTPGYTGDPVVKCYEERGEFTTLNVKQLIPLINLGNVIRRQNHQTYAIYCVTISHSSDNFVF
ncbi:unnamed protein product [Schistosoma margrebowiei]|uniref:Uncharacterized protein n=1 Tax=Schistosoma margrebowiei TaxID=48269 RepID=A0A183M6H9_9TREM|nr:unnamed protein product [Schistosoma margrebowiei]